MGRRERLGIYATGKEKESLIEQLPPPHRIFFAIFQQAEKDIEDSVKFIKSGKAAQMFKENGWTNEHHWSFTNLKESIYFFSDRDGHLTALADCANVDLTNRQYKERIAVNLSIGKAAQDIFKEFASQIKQRLKQQVEIPAIPKNSPVSIPEMPGLSYYPLPLGHH